MQDNLLIALLKAQLEAQEEGAGIPGLSLKQSFQPTQQGTNTTPASYFHKVRDYRRGSPCRSDEWVPNPPPNPDDLGRMMHTEAQEMETTFQISTLSTQDPKNITQLTASDLLNAIAYILQSTEFIEAMQKHDVQILKIGQIENPAFGDDRARYEYNPTLDFTLTHKNIVITYGPVVSSIEIQIFSV